MENNSNNDLIYNNYLNKIKKENNRSTWDMYLENIIRQFRQATKFSGNINSEIGLDTLSEWIFQRQNAGIDYLFLLHDLGLNYSNNDTCEVGKGLYDSITTGLSTKIITQYPESIKVDESRILVGNLEVFESTPILIRENASNIKIIPNSLVNTYMMNNPYVEGNIRSWEDLHNSSQNDIIVGVYGKTSDKDKEDKLKLIKDLRDKLYDEYIDSYETNNDNYYYVVGSKRYPHEKRLVKTKVIDDINYKRFY